MMERIKTRARVLGRHLTRLDSQPIGRAAMAVVILLDLFILVSIFDGLAEHTRQLTSPHDYVPSICRQTVIEGEWNTSNRLQRIAAVVGTPRERYFRADEREARISRHPVCERILLSINAIRDDQPLAGELSTYLKLRLQTRHLGAELGEIKGAYDTTLLEEMADPQAPQRPTQAIEARVAAETGEMNQLVAAERELKARLEENARLQELFAYVESVPAGERSELLAELRERNFWYPLQRLGMEMIFLLPLFIIFYFWNSRSIARSRPLQTLVSSHLMVVAFIPVLFKLAELLYDIIPRKLLANLIALLESLHLVALWHYLLMAAAIAAALAAVYLFQKKLFSREKLLEKRIARGLCQDCGALLAPGSAACTACGYRQFRDCPHCGEATHVHGRFCRACGGALSA